jgi:hypothetical protein
LVVVAFPLVGCVTVKPQDRTILADPLMQIGESSPAQGQISHAIENREGANGGEGVSGGGCGCN